MNEKEGQVGFKDDTRNKGFGDFEIAIKLSEKNKVCQKKQKKYQNVFKSSPNNINKGGYKSEEPKSALQKLKNIEMHYKAR